MGILLVVCGEVDRVIVLVSDGCGGIGGEVDERGVFCVGGIGFL